MFLKDRPRPRWFRGVDRFAADAVDHPGSGCHLRLTRLLIQLGEVVRKLSADPDSRQAIALVFSQRVEIEEMAGTRAWGSISQNAIVDGGTRLYDRARARVRLGVSPLGGTRVSSYGDPERDIRSTGAVSLPRA